MRLILLLALFVNSFCFRMAWRPSTKVFPYKKFPEPSVIDNGDNAGTVAEEVVILQPVEST